MVTYTCPRCGYETSLKGNFRVHVGRKNPCPPKLSDVNVDTSFLDSLETNKNGYVCDFCSRTFQSSQSKYQHKQRCPMKDHVNIVSKVTTDDRIAVLEEEILKLKKERQHINNVTTQNNIQINVDNRGNGCVKLRKFGCENMKALPTQLLESLFLDLKFRELLENLHCDPDYPENHNVRIKSTKRELMEVYRNNKWDIMTFVNGLNELLLQGQRIFTDYYRRNRDKILEEDMDEDDLKEIVKQLNAIETLNEDDIKPIRKELQLMLESHRVQMIVPT